MMAERPNVPFKEMMGIVATTWKELTPEEKQLYERLSQIDKVRHDRQVVEFNAYLENNKGSVFFPPKQRKQRKGKGVHMETPTIASGGIQQLNASNMNNPQFLVQMIA
jgi:hypothetical protein